MYGIHVNTWPSDFWVYPKTLFVILFYFNFWYFISRSFFSVRRFTFSKFWNSSADSQNIIIWSFQAKVTMITFLFYYSFSVVFHTHHTSLTSGLLVGSGNTHSYLVRYIEDCFDTSTTDLSELSLYLSGFFFSYGRCSRCFLHLVGFIPPNFC